MRLHNTDRSTAVDCSDTHFSSFVNSFDGEYFGILLDDNQLGPFLPDITSIWPDWANIWGFVSMKRNSISTLSNPSFFNESVCTLPLGFNLDLSENTIEYIPVDFFGTMCSRIL
jgi:hypothetical protein